MFRKRLWPLFKATFRSRPEKSSTLMVVFTCDDFERYSAKGWRLYEDVRDLSDAETVWQEKSFHSTVSVGWFGPGICSIALSSCWHQANQFTRFKFFHRSRFAISLLGRTERSIGGECGGREGRRIHLQRIPKNGSRQIAWCRGLS